MQKNMTTNTKWLLGVMVMVVIGLLVTVMNPPEVDLSGYISNEDALEAQNIAVEEALIDKDNEILSLQTELDSLSEEEVVVELGYLVDELFLGTLFLMDTYSDRELNLFDGEVDFDGEDYDAEETLVLQNIEFVANGNDFDGAVYMSVPAGAIEYTLTFDGELNTSLITDDETLEFDFLGDSYEVSSWDVGEITLTKGEEYLLDMGDSLTIGEQVIVLESVSDTRVYVTVDGVGKVVDEGQTRLINGVEVRARDIFNSETRRFAVLVIAEEIETTIVDRDEYEEDSAWEWAISANSIGLVLVESHTQVDADGDEDFPAVAVGESLCLPNDYVCVQSNGMADEDQDEVSFRLDERDGQDYVRVDGNFLNGLEDYSRIYVNSSGIYDRDLELISNESVELGDTESILNISTGQIVINDFEVNFDLNVSNVGTDNEDYLTNYGIRVVNPDDSADDNEYSIAVPREQIEGSFSLLM